MSSAMTQAVSEISIPVPWGEIKARVWGPDDGYPVLCLHGKADNCGSFNTLIPLLPKEFRYVALDLAGHGLSSHRPSGVFYSLFIFVADVQKVVKALNWTKFSIIGHSMGGNIGGMFTALYPEQVDALILLDSSGFFPQNAGEISKMYKGCVNEMLQYEEKAEKKIRVYTYEKALKRLMSANQTLSERSAHILLQHGLIPVKGGFVFSRDPRLNLVNTLHFTLEQSLKMQLRMKPSILIVLADKGLRTFHDSEQQGRISVLLQGYRDKNHTVVTVPGDHHVHLNNPERIAPLVSDFLRTKMNSKWLAAL